MTEDDFCPASSTTDVFLAIHAFFTAILIVMGCMYLIFASPTAENWTPPAVILLSSLIIFVILFVFSALIRMLTQKMSLLTRCRCFLIIGYGGIALCSIASRISVYVFTGDDHICSYVIFLSNVTCFLIYYLILQPYYKHCNINYEPFSTPYWVLSLLALHFIGLVVTIRVAVALFPTGDAKVSKIFCQIGFSFICAASTIDFWQVLRVGVKAKTSSNNNNQVQNQMAENIQNFKVAEIPAFRGNCKDIKDKEQNYDFKVECKICLLEYSKTRIPRILKECGHTICEKCVNKLLNKNNRIFLFCPFCKEVTLVKGFANLLPKNYVTMEVVEKMK